MSLDVRKPELRDPTERNPEKPPNRTLGRLYGNKVKDKTVRQLVIGLALVIVTAVCTWLLASPGSPQATVTMDKAGPNVGQFEAITGKAHDLADGDAVYVLVQAAGDSRFYPQHNPCPIANGQYKCDRVQFGGTGSAAHKAYAVIVVTANGIAQRALLDYERALAKNPRTPGLTAIPAGAKEMARQSVNRVS
jgi:hypothetical protein